MANYVLIRHGVENFPEWKTAYDAHKPERQAAGVTENQLFQDIGDANMVTILFDVEDLDRAKEFTSSDDLREIMQKAGVIGKPEIHFIEN